MIKIVNKEHLDIVNKFKRCWEVYTAMQDAIELGLYTKNSNKEIDFVLNNMDEIRNFFYQFPNTKCEFNESMRALKNIVEKLQ